MEQTLREEDAANWVYRGEGAVLVLAYNGSNPSFILALTLAFNVTGDHCPYFIKCFLPCVLSGICGPLRKLMEQNAQAFNQITNNLSSYKLQDNIDLFCHTRHNICSILNDHFVAIPLVLVLPYLFRLNQCLRQYKDTGEKTCLLNGKSYLLP
ncbi:hypothetical protein AHAS_Ahas16G0261100 [Arachis hypogaea]